MKYAEAAENVKQLVVNLPAKEAFIVELLLAYDTPKATIARLKSGAINLSNENPADVKAAEKMAKLFDAIRQDNAETLCHDAHAMNVFLGRLLFCLFAEDTNIFPENAVRNAIASHTADDGSDLDVFFKQLFDWLDTSDAERDLTTEYIEDTEARQEQVLTTESSETQSRKKLCSSVSSSEAGGENSFLSSLRNLPYVNGGVFRDHYDIPGFSAKSRRMLIQAGTLDWKDINPDIFGSMFQAVIDPDKMPAGLREAHHNHTVDRLYRSKPFTSDEERLEHLFKLYEEMTAKEQLV